MAKADSASALFRQVWAPLDARREAKEISPKTIAEKCGFKRSAWFVYRSKGTIPFHMLERVAHYLGVRLQVSVTTVMSEGAATPSSSTGVSMPEYLESIAGLLEEVPEKHREFASGVAYNAVKEALRSLPFEEPSAGAKASRSRGSK